MTVETHHNLATNRVVHTTIVNLGPGLTKTHTRIVNLGPALMKTCPVIAVLDHVIAGTDRDELQGLLRVKEGRNGPQVLLKKISSGHSTKLS